jgi:hypothetical protein
MQIHGFVKSHFSKKPVAGAQVKVHDQNVSVTTDSLGFYKFSDLKVGVYSIGVDDQHHYLRTKMNCKVLKNYNGYRVV